MSYRRVNANCRNFLPGQTVHVVVSAARFFATNHKRELLVWTLVLQAGEGSVCRQARAAIFPVSGVTAAAESAAGESPSPPHAFVLATVSGEHWLHLADVLRSQVPEARWTLRPRVPARWRHGAGLVLRGARQAWKEAGGAGGSSLLHVGAAGLGLVAAYKGVRKLRQRWQDEGVARQKEQGSSEYRFVSDMKQVLTAMREKGEASTLMIVMSDKLGRFFVSKPSERLLQEVVPLSAKMDTTASIVSVVGTFISDKTGLSDRHNSWSRFVWMGWSSSASNIVVLHVRGLEEYGTSWGQPALPAWLESGYTKSLNVSVPETFRLLCGGEETELLQPLLNLPLVVEPSGLLRDVSNGDVWVSQQGNPPVLQKVNGTNNMSPSCVHIKWNKRRQPELYVGGKSIRAIDCPTLHWNRSKIPWFTLASLPGALRVGAEHVLAYVEGEQGSPFTVSDDHRLVAQTIKKDCGTVEVAKPFGEATFIKATYLETNANASFVHLVKVNASSRTDITPTGGLKSGEFPPSWSFWWKATLAHKVHCLSQIPPLESPPSDESPP